VQLSPEGKHGGPHERRSCAHSPLDGIVYPWLAIPATSLRVLHFIVGQHVLCSPDREGILQFNGNPSPTGLREGSPSCEQYLGTSAGCIRVSTVPIPTELVESSRRLARRAANPTHNKQQYRQLACRFARAVRLYDCEWPKEGTER
jgi:hypothetical protein